MSGPSVVEDIFLAALEQGTPEERVAFLDAACKADSELRRRVERLLEAHPKARNFLEQPAGAAEAETTPPTSVQAGAVIAGRYKLLHPIGEGGMGSVWMAQQINPVTRLVAVKLIKAGMDSGAVLARFEAERQALAVMDHPNIAKVLDGGTTEGGRPFFVMELVKGTPITRYCDEHRLPLRQRLELFVAVCQALQHAHQKGIVHRDLKPSNVLVAPYDGRPVPKVIDFGVAKATGPRLTERTLFTEFGAIIGTLQYMSPEQAELNNLDIDTRSDIYSLGVLLYELLTGTTPLDMQRLRGAAMAAVLMAIHEEEPPKPSTRLSQSGHSMPSIAAQRQTEPAKLSRLVRGELDWIVMKALEKDRDRRYETANGLSRDLERYLHDEVVEAQPPSAGYLLRKFARKHRTALTTAATILLLLLAGVAVSSWQAIRATRAEGAARAAEGRALDEQGKTAQALTVADEQRKKAETLAASLAVDIDLKHCEGGEVPFGLLRLAQTLRTSIPENDRELRECVALNILAWGQQLRPAIAALEHDGYRVGQAVLSPDGLTVLTRGQDGTARLWDSLTGKQRAILDEVWPRQMSISYPPEQNPLQFSSDGRTVLTLHARRVENAGDAGLEATDSTVCLWDVATGRLRAETAKHPGQVREIHLSRHSSLLVTTAATRIPMANGGYMRAGGTAVFAWNAETGQLIRKLELKGDTRCAVSPDGRSVLITNWQFGKPQIQVWLPHQGSSPKLLPGIVSSLCANASYSPRGKSAVTVSEDAVCWWNTSDWQLQQKSAALPYQAPWGNPTLAGFVHEDIVKFLIQEGPFSAQCLFARGRPEPIVDNNTNECRASPNGSLVAFDVDDVYESHSGERRALPRGRRFDPELRQFTEDGRYALFPNAFVADLAVEKKIVALGASRFLKDQNAWIGIGPSNGICFLRKEDASLDAELLEKWCQVVTCRELGEGGRYRKLDEATWDKRRQELSLRLDTNTDAQVLRAAATDQLYWVRKEIEDSTDPVPLLDRLVAAEPSWPNYTRRAAAHFKLEHWAEAARDDLEAARLAGDLYWLKGSPFIGANNPDFPLTVSQTSRTAWQLGVSLVQAPGCPRKQYELAMRWAEARSRAGIGGEPKRTTMIALARFRLGQYSDALAMLRKRNVPTLSLAAGLLMSPWILMTAYERGAILGSNIHMKLKDEFTLDPIDLTVLAMCHHQLGHPQEAAASLQQACELLGLVGPGGGFPEQRALLNEAETLIEGKGRP